MGNIVVGAKFPLLACQCFRHIPTHTKHARKACIQGRGDGVTHRSHSHSASKVFRLLSVVNTTHLIIKVPKLFRKTPQKRGGLPHSVLRTLRLTLSFVADRQANNDRKKELKKGQASTPKKNNKRSVFMASVTFEKSSFARSGKNSSVFSDDR